MNIFPFSPLNNLNFLSARPWLTATAGRAVAHFINRCHPPSPKVQLTFSPVTGQYNHQSNQVTTTTTNYHHDHHHDDDDHHHHDHHYQNHQKSKKNQIFQKIKKFQKKKKFLKKSKFSKKKSFFSKLHDTMAQVFRSYEQRSVLVAIQKPTNIPLQFGPYNA